MTAVSLSTAQLPSSVPSEFTPEIATIFSSLSSPVHRPCLARVRASSRGVYLAEQSVAPGSLVHANQSPGSSRITARAVARRGCLRWLDVDRMNVRVSAPGYKPFLGSVKAADIHPDGYFVRLEDVWIAPAGSALTSRSPR